MRYDPRKYFVSTMFANDLLRRRKKKYSLIEKAATPFRDVGGTQPNRLPP